LYFSPGQKHAGAGSFLTENVSIMKKLFPAIASVLLGISLTFAFAPFKIFPLAVLAPAGLLALWLKVAPSAKKAFWLGFLFGVGLFSSGVYWIFTSIHVFGAVSTPLAVFITMGFICILSLFPASAGALLNYNFPKLTTQKLVFAFPAMWVGFEWLRSLAGFPWLLLGYSQDHSPLKGFAPILSVYGVSLALAIISALLVNAVIRYKQNDLKSCYKNIAALVLIWIIGGLLSFIPWTIPQGKPLTVSLIQGNIPQTIKWSPEHLQFSLETYTNLTQPLWGKSDLIIWPEAAVPIPLQDAKFFVNALDEKASESNTALIFGIPIHADAGYYNSIILLGKEKGVYSKRLLVPFGEYTPFSRFLSNALQFMEIPLSETVAGKSIQPPLIVNGIKILPSICYEIAFPQLTRSLDKSIGLLLVVTNDAWFGNSTAEPQHLQMAAMRAIEFHKPVLFVSNDGITAIITPNGKIEQSIPIRKATVLNGTVQPMYGTTPWLVNGMDPILMIIIIFITLTVLASKKAEGTTNKKQMRTQWKNNTNRKK
jgi:apolipoprotein N-acyltransferase